ncbi:hypothetical protein V1358_04570 [Pseudoalteromonas sp. YIC-656]|uniref:hypothetical protein n=1 Tax=Pseudoalteromonas pernae TaxID=3118054 RepID=UPI003241FFC2
MNHREFDKLKQAHEYEKQQNKLTGSEKRALLAMLSKTDRTSSTRNWWQQSQWLVACCALITLVSITLLEFRSDKQALYSVVAYEHIEIYDEVNGQQRVRVSQQVPKNVRSINSAEQQLANNLRVQQQAYSALGSEQPVRVARLVQREGDWLLADCRQQVLIALSEDLADKVVRESDLNAQPGALLALTFSAQGQLLTVSQTEQAKQCS